MSRRFLMGNEAIALGAMHAGVHLVAGYPGTPSTEILETVAKNNDGSIHVEAAPGANKYELQIEIGDRFKSRIGISVVVKPVDLGELPRSEKKSTRVFDNRY